MPLPEVLGSWLRRRQHIEPQVLSNSGIYDASRRKSAKQSQAVRESTGRVSELRARRIGSFQHDVGHDARLFSTCHQLFQPIVHGRTNLAILIKRGVGFEEVRVERRLCVRRLDDDLLREPTTQFGGVTNSIRSPGGERMKPIRSSSIEIMAGTFDLEFWSKLRQRLEWLDQQESLSAR